MVSIDDMFEISPFSLNKTEKDNLLKNKLLLLTEHHRRNCEAYAKILSAYGFNPDNVKSHYDIPFIPVRLFKNYELLSIGRNEIFKTMTSSGTSGQSVSKIFVDKTTANNQQKTLIRIMSDFIGKKRLPMLLIDSPNVVKDRNLFSARGAAILGLRMLGRETLYALDDNMQLKLDEVQAFLEKNRDSKIIIFGFTFMVWQHLYQELLKQGLKLDLSNAFLITGGGWKKLVSLNISNADFRAALNSQCGIEHFIDHYGMVEQTGCIYAQCEYGHLHASIFSDVIPRRADDFSVCEKGEEGIIQVVSVLPHSYPGHSILTEDKGIILGEDDCPCGRLGKYFKLTGRLKNAELRGCSDTYADKF
ncbi:Phenylacetate-coenzyme A ligase PaaK, adenylate-forming domain family [Succinivibrio dextrinosolvens]|uniref:LuxE/PaaK family acyltransferase n=1 Tax=Succinivibrio dextrinosolvens TaxID=83771 RepID=UPI0008E98AD6|nr:acyl-protein synthetase [Succinivibrio dextrinosolvens]SFS82225.1 Phenylacetate-coenzyme A ligase PaaK, adenylate-forming domain family [Succinivibrio dextrinosolvens]